MERGADCRPSAFLFVFRPAVGYNIGIMYRSRLRENLPRVKDRIAAASERAGGTAEVTLVGITKGHPADAVRAALEAGLSRCGENRAGEFESKAAELEANPADTGPGVPEWHFVGHLQRNKVRGILPLFRLIHSVDSIRLARELSRRAGQADRTVDSLVQVNTSGEDSKGGFEPGEAVDAVGRIADMDRLGVLGLMTMAPLTDREDVLHSAFGEARRLFEECERQIPAFQARHLSMGMSNDFEIAVEEGSTMVRLGTILFGERPQ